MCKFEQKLEFLLEISQEKWKISFENVLFAKDIDFKAFSKIHLRVIPDLITSDLEL